MQLGEGGSQLNVTRYVRCGAWGVGRGTGVGDAAGAGVVEGEGVGVPERGVEEGVLVGVFVGVLAGVGVYGTHGCAAAPRQRNAARRRKPVIHRMARLPGSSA